MPNASLREKEQKEDSITYSCLLKNELLGTSYENTKSAKEDDVDSPLVLKESRNLFKVAN